MRKLIGLPLVTAMAYLVGCAIVPYAREVKKKPSSGGVIALRTTHSPEDRAKADTLMRSNCGSAEVKVLEEGEVVVGEKTNSTANSNYHAGNPGTQKGIFTFGASNPGYDTNTSQETVKLTEWQIQYECHSKSSNKKG